LILKFKQEKRKNESPRARNNRAKSAAAVVSMSTKPIPAEKCGVTAGPELREGRKRKFWPREDEQLEAKTATEEATQTDHRHLARANPSGEGGEKVRAELLELLNKTAPPGMVVYTDDGIHVRYVTPLAARCLRNNEAVTYRRTFNLAGIRFGKLRVFRRSRHRRRKAWLWECKCDCGEKCLVVGYSLTSGATQSCGCLRKETGKKMGEARKGMHWKLKARKAAA
jgi:hypothetical protein